MGMALDIRLACLRDAILEDWIDLEAYEADGTLVIRLKDGVEAIEKLEKEQHEKPAAKLGSARKSERVASALAL